MNVSIILVQLYNATKPYIVLKVCAIISQYIYNENIPCLTASTPTPLAQS